MTVFGRYQSIEFHGKEEVAMKKGSLAVHWGGIILAVLFVSAGWAQQPYSNETMKLSLTPQVPTALAPVGGYQVAQAEDTEAAAVEAAPDFTLMGGAPACDHSWEDSFARPVTNFRFDHPFIWNELRPMFVEHSFPKDSAMGGGKLRVYTSQFQLKLSERVGLVALKAGFVEFNPGALQDEEGWADLAAGLKFNLINDPAQQFALSLGTVYEMSQGTHAIFQGGGSDGIWDLYLSAAKGCGRTHIITTAGFDVPNNRSNDTPVFHYHAHADYSLTSYFAPLVELNGYHYFETADRNAGLGAPLDFEGFDYANFGSSNAGGDHVTMGVGFRLDLFKNAKFGTAYEWSLTDRKDLFEDRVTCDISYRF